MLQRVIPQPALNVGMGLHGVRHALQLPFDQRNHAVAVRFADHIRRPLHHLLTDRDGLGLHPKLGLHLPAVTIPIPLPGRLLQTKGSERRPRALPLADSQHPGKEIRRIPAGMTGEAVKPVVPVKAGHGGLMIIVEGAQPHPFTIPGALALQPQIRRRVVAADGLRCLKDRHALHLHRHWGYIRSPFVHAISVAQVQ